MGSGEGNWTFEKLTKLNKKQLDQLMFSGATPTLASVNYREYKGWNINPATRLFGTRKFKKGFFGDPARKAIWGYNVRVKQNKKDQPWQAVPNEENPKRFAFFKVYTAESVGHTKYPNSLIVNYAEWGEYFFLNPVKYTVDYCILPDPANADLLVGKSYFEAGFIKFFLGYFILEKYNDSNYRRVSHYLTLKELRTVEKFAEVFIEGRQEAILPREISWNIDRQLERMRSKRRKGIKLVLFFIEHLLAFPRSFSKLDPRRRKAVIEKTLEKPRSPLFRDLARDLAKVRQIFLAGYYMDERVYDSIKFIRVPDRKRFSAEPPTGIGLKDIKIFAPATPTVDTGVCVIGSGAGGAVIAYHAAAAGRNVMLLEEGEYVKPRTMTHDEAAMVNTLYKEGGLQNTVDFDMAILQGKALGGTTVVNNAICFRLTDQAIFHPEGPGIFERWAALGARIDPAKLDESYARVERMIHVAPLAKKIAGNNAGVLLDGWKKLSAGEGGNSAFKAGLMKKNYNDCLGCGYCNFGCRYERKMSMLETYIPAAAEEGAQIVPGCHAVKIETAGGKAMGVRCTMADGRQVFIRAQNVIVSAGAIGSSVLLMKSGITRNVGTRFSFNAGTPMFARFDKTMNGFDGVQMASYLDSGNFILETLFNPPMSFAMALPGWFDKHFSRMLDYSKMACIGVLIGTEANGRVKRKAWFRDLFGPVDYQMTPSDLQNMKNGMALAAKIFFAAGATAVYPASFRDLELTSPELAESTIQNAIKRPNDLTLGSSHPQGGNPMSDNTAIGAVSSEFRVHGYDNLFVCDASVFPTTIRINPQLTIMAMADYLWHLGVI